MYIIAAKKDGRVVQISRDSMGLALGAVGKLVRLGWETTLWFEAV
jgi:hypothetical protein